VIPTQTKMHFFPQPRRARGDDSAASTAIQATNPSADLEQEQDYGRSVQNMAGVMGDVPVC
jgi:hypothetical protein